MRRKDLLLTPYFLICLILLILNDTYFKWTFHNELTGKLSDFTGLYIFPIFIAYLFPKITKYSALLVGVFFIIWKSPYSSPFIDFINLNSFFEFHRVIDYTDYFALMVLPFSHFSLTEKQLNIPKIQNKQLVSFLRPIVLISAFVKTDAINKMAFAPIDFASII